MKKKSFPIPTAILLLIIVSITALIYSNSLHGPFVFDDNGYIIADQAVHLTHLDWSGIVKAATEGRPSHRLLPNASFAVNYYFGRLNTTGYHIVNIIIHLFAGIFLFLFIKSTLILYSDAEKRKRKGLATSPPLNADPILIAFFTALIWTVYPVQTESVTYIVQRMTSMAAMFYILSMLLYVRGRMAARAEKRNRIPVLLYFSGCVIAGACALASKENTATLPFFILIYEWYFFQDLKPISKRLAIWIIGAVIIFAGAALVYLGENPIHRILASYAHRDFTLHQRVLTELRVVVYYLSLLIWPAPSRLNLDLNYPLSHSLIHPPTTLLCLAAIFGLIYLAIYCAKKDRLLSFAIVWFLGNLVIESSVIGIEIIFDHRTYLPFMIAVLVPVILVFRYTRKRTAIFILCGISLLLAVWTYQRNQTWRSAISFWTDSIHKSPDKARGYKNLAYALQAKGDTAKAIAYYKEALKIGPADFATYSNLGTAYLLRKMYYDAAYYYGEAFKISGVTPGMHRVYASALVMIGDFEAARKEYQQALMLNPSDKVAKKDLEELAAFMRRFETPEERIEEMIRRYPKNPALHIKQGDLFMQEGNFRQAAKAYQTALSLVRPQGTMTHVAALSGLAGSEAALGDFSQALVHFKKLTSLMPENPMFYYNAAAIYAAENKTEASVRYLKKAAEHGMDIENKTRNTKIFERVRQSYLYRKLLYNLKNIGKKSIPSK